MSGERLPTIPYKGLVPYAEEDAPFFFGREREREIISANLLSSKLTLLYGPSGVGKSSVLRAGVASHLRQVARENAGSDETPEYAVVVFSSWRDDPTAGLVNAIRESVAAQAEGMTLEPVRADSGLIDVLERWTAQLDGELLVILDQFEEYFLYHGSELAEGTFGTELARAVNRRDLRVNFLVATREDSLAKLDAFKGRIPNLFDNYLRIDHLDRVAARAAVERPIEKYNALRTRDDGVMSIEPEAVEAVLDQVEAGQVVIGETGRGVVGGVGGTSGERRIETPYLQLVMTRLWNEEVAAGSAVLRLATLDALGGAERIVRTHLDAAMAALPDEDRETAAKIFRFLVTPSGTKIAHTAVDLALYGEVEEDAVGPILERLCAADVRILRPVAPPPDQAGPVRYEIYHDVLAAAILDWRARFSKEKDLAEGRRRSAIEPLQGKARALTLHVAIGSLLVTLPLLIANGTDASIARPGLAALTSGSVVVGLLALVAVGVRLWQMWRAARRAMEERWDGATIVELVADRRGDGAALVAGGGKYFGLDEDKRHRIRKGRIRHACWTLVAWILPAPSVAVAILLGSGWGLLEPEALAWFVGAAVGMALLVAMSIRTREGLTMFRLRRRKKRRPSLAGLFGRPRGEWHAWTAAPPVEPASRRGWVLRHGVWLAAGVWLVTVGSALAVAQMTLVAEASRVLLAIAVPNVSRTEERAAESQAARPYRLPIDSTISPLDAGRALYALSEAGNDSGPFRADFAQPIPRRLPAWFSSGEESPFGDEIQRVADTLIWMATDGFSAAQIQYLERVVTHPGFHDYATAARASQSDWVGARFRLPLPNELHFFELPIIRFLPLRDASRAHVAKAALELSQGRVREAEHTLREMLSLGLLLVDDQDALIGNLVGATIATEALDRLSDLYIATGRTAEARRISAARESALSRLQERREAEPPVEFYSNYFNIDNVRGFAIRRIADTRTVRGLRWEFLPILDMLLCSSVTELAFGLHRNVPPAVWTAHDQLVRFPGEEEQFELVSSTWRLRASWPKSFYRDRVDSLTVRLDSLRSFAARVGEEPRGWLASELRAATYARDTLEMLLANRTSWPARTRRPRVDGLLGNALSTLARTTGFLLGNPRLPECAVNLAYVMQEL